MKHSLALALSLTLSLVVGCGDSSTPSASSGPFRTPTVATLAGGFTAPLDAAPSPDGATIYFIARGGDHGPGLFRVTATGGNAAEVAVGAPFATPRGLAVSSDGTRIVVADATAGTRGGLYVVPASGGAPTLLAGTEGTSPQGLEVVSQNGADQVYFTGVASDGSPAVFQIALAGGAARVVARGAMLHHPQAIAVNRAGVVFVSARERRHGRRRGAPHRRSAVSALVNNVRLGDPAGITLSPDERVLGVSSLHPTEGTCQVLLVDVATGMTSTFSDVIRANRAAGGVHRAHGGASTDLAWADLTAGGTGVVYRISFR
ncbi:MAG: hypothetical protein U0326_40205 [Polyangiales bacterium]